jgi:hypothetical protein
MYVVLENFMEANNQGGQAGVVSAADVKAYFERATKDISEYDYGHLKYSTLNTQLR